MKIETHRFRLSEFDCLIVNDGKFVMDAFPPEIVLAGASEEEIRQALQQHDSDPAQWRVGFNFSCLVINTGDRLVLVDTGCGATDFMPDVGHLPEGLAAEGLAPADIDTVILTHGHWDHVAGLVDLNGKLVFPDAEFVMWREEWEFWNDKANAALLYQNYNDQDKVPFATVPLIKDRVRLIEAESEILPGSRQSRRRAIQLRTLPWLSPPAMSSCYILLMLFTTSFTLNILTGITRLILIPFRAQQVSVSFFPEPLPKMPSF